MLRRLFRPRYTPEDWYGVAKFTAAMGIAAIVLTSIVLVPRVLFYLRSVSTQGKIVGLFQDRNDSSVYIREIAFTDAEGKEHTVRLPKPRRLRRSISVGDEVELLYDPQNLADVRERRFETLWGAFAVVFGGGVNLLFWSVAAMIGLRWWMRKKERPPNGVE